MALDSPGSQLAIPNCHLTPEAQISERQYEEVSMMTSSVRTVFAIAVLTGLVICGGAKGAQDQEHYRRAITNNSTSPYFVLVTIKDDAADGSFTGCVSANFLKGAIYLELGGKWDSPGDDEKRKAELALLRKAGEIALNSPDHEFHFSKPAALANIPKEYSEDELIEARKAVQFLGLKTLEGNGPERRSLGKLERSTALACAIIEQGASARRADITSQIFAEP